MKVEEEEEEEEIPKKKTNTTERKIAGGLKMKTGRNAMQLDEESTEITEEDCWTVISSFFKTKGKHNINIK